MRLIALALTCGVALAACAADDPARPADPAIAAGTAPSASSAAPSPPATSGDATPPPLEPPPMAVEPPPRRMPGTPGPGQVEPQCDADAAQAYLGREASADVVEAARRAAGAEVVRTLSPGQMVTMEYHFSRLNLDVDEDNVIVGVRCG